MPARFRTGGSGASSVVVSNEVEVKNDTGNPVPVSATELTSLNGKIPDESGTWGYNAGASGSVTLTGSKRLLGITATGGTSAASMTINGGDTITIPANQAIDFEPRGNVTDPEIVFTSTVAYVVEYVV